MCSFVVWHLCVCDLPSMLTDWDVTSKTSLAHTMKNLKQLMHETVYCKTCYMEVLLMQEWPSRSTSQQIHFLIVHLNEMELDLIPVSVLLSKAFDQQQWLFSIVFFNPYFPTNSLSYIIAYFKEIQVSYNWINQWNIVSRIYNVLEMLLLQ